MANRPALTAGEMVDLMSQRKIYFLRHGEADWPDWQKPDDERPLTKFGDKEMHRVAKFLASRDVQPDAILTSPLPRAAETAEIATEYLNTKCREEKLLAPGFDSSKLEKILTKDAQETLMLVGHEPDFSKTIRALTGANVKLSKAGVALVEIDSSSQKGRLLWLFPPKLAKK